MLLQGSKGHKCGTCFIVQTSNFRQQCCGSGAKVTVLVKSAQNTDMPAPTLTYLTQLSNMKADDMNFRRVKLFNIPYRWKTLHLKAGGISDAEVKVTIPCYSVQDVQ